MAADCANWQTGTPFQAAVVVDATDGLSAAQRADMWSYIRPIADDAHAGSIFHLYEVRSTVPGGFREVSTVPRPPHRCEVNSWSDNPAQREAQWEPLYLEPLRDALGEMARAESSESSAVFQAVQAAARRFNDDRETSQQNASHQLILVSDLMQNVGVDFYSDIPDFDDFKESSLYRYVRTRHLEGADVTVLQLALPKRVREFVDETALQDFWRAYFEEQEVAAVKFNEVQGSPVEDDEELRQATGQP